jgi:hypothetical protein
MKNLSVCFGAIFLLATSSAMASPVPVSTANSDAGLVRLADIRVYKYQHNPGDAPQSETGQAQTQQGNSNRPNDSQRTVCQTERVRDNSGHDTWKKTCRTGYF